MYQLIAVIANMHGIILTISHSDCHSARSPVAILEPSSPLVDLHLPHSFPILSMYGIFTYMWFIFRVDVSKYTMHGCFGFNKETNTQRSFRTFHVWYELPYFVPKNLTSNIFPQETKNLTDHHHHSGQIIIFHQPRFP